MHAEAGAEGRRIHLGHAVGKEHLCNDAVVVEHLVARRGIPSAGKLCFVAAAPLLVDLGDEEVVAHAPGRLDLDGQRGVEGVVILRVHVGAVVGGVQPSVPVR